MKKLKKKFYNKIGAEKAEKLEKVLNVARIVKNIVCWCVIAVLVFAVITFLLARVNGGTPSVFGYTLHRVESGSMRPALEVGDVILNKDISDNSEVAIGDIITFQGDARFENRKVTHRVVVAPFQDDDGDWVVMTQGDANEVADGQIKMRDVESKVLHKVEFLKVLYGFFFSPIGLIVFILLLLLIFFDEVLNIIRIATGKYDEQESVESIGEIIERIQNEEKNMKHLKQTVDEEDTTNP